MRRTQVKRLRSVGVSVETREARLGDAVGAKTAHYSAAHLAEAITAAEKVPERGVNETPNLISVGRKTPSIVVKVPEMRISAYGEKGTPARLRSRSGVQNAAAFCRTRPRSNQIYTLQKHRAVTEPSATQSRAARNSACVGDSRPIGRSGVSATCNSRSSAHSRVASMCPI